MKKELLMAAVACAVYLTACGAASNRAVSDSTRAGTVSGTAYTAAQAVDDVNLDNNDVAVFDQCTARIEKVALSADGTLSVDITFTNLGSTAMYMYESFSVAALQDGKTLQDKTDINNGSGAEKAVLTEVSDGKSARCTYKFAGASKGQVMIDICEPTADQTLLIEHLYQLDTFATE